MCNSCFVLKKLFEGSESDSHQNYIPTFNFIKEMVRQGRLELFAGDCPLDEMEKHLAEEFHFTIRHYFKCKSCYNYFFIGACIRGTPIYEAMEDLNGENFDNTLWGHYGTLYDKK